MNRKIIAFLLLSGFVIQSFGQALLVLNFYVNRTYISNKLCEKRYEPGSCCHGKCFLMKKLKQEDKKDQENPERKMESKQELFASRISFPYLPGAGVVLIQHNFENHTSPYCCLFRTSIFHPPSMA